MKKVNCIIVVLLGFVLLVGCSNSTTAEISIPNSKIKLYELGNASVIEDVTTGDLILEFTSGTNSYKFYQPYKNKTEIQKDPELLKELQRKGYK
jgi:major membrane immunogen (membrane-anchored lipoprotein)